MIKPHYIDCDIYIISDCIIKSTQRRSPNPGETRLLMRTKRMSLPRRPSEVEVVQPVSQIWMTTIQRAKVKNSKGQICTWEWIFFFNNGLVRVRKFVALFSLRSLFYTWKWYLLNCSSLKFSSSNIFWRGKKERKEIMGRVTLLQGYTCIFYLNFVKIWLCHYYFLEVMLQIALSLCSESCLCFHFF